MITIKSNQVLLKFICHACRHGHAKPEAKSLANQMRSH